MKDVGEKQEEPTTLFCDNKSAIAMARNPVFHNRTKHIELKHHFIHEAIEEWEVDMDFCKSEGASGWHLYESIAVDKF